MEGEMSIEISYQEVREAIKAIGFIIEKQDLRKTTYTSNKRSMMQVVYNCVHFIAEKHYGATATALISINKLGWGNCLTATVVRAGPVSGEKY